MRLFRNSLALVLVMMTAFPSTLAFAANRARDTKRFGAYLSLNGDPTPAGFGANAAYNLSSFLQLHAGVGGYSDWMGPNLGAGVWNYTGRPLLFGLAYSVVWFLTWIGQVMFGTKMVKLRYGEFADLKADYTHKQSFSFGTGATLLVPDWSLSPAAGVHYTRYMASGNPWGLSDSGNVVYYSLGLNWQTNSGLAFSGGVNICPSLSSAACGGYGNIGYFF